jgi:hypothetical protein
MKGISRFVSYTFIILFGFVMLTLFTTSLYKYYNNVLKANINAGLKQIAIETTSQIIKIYDMGKDSEASPANASTVVIADMNLKYPKKISGKNYEILLISSPGIWTQIKSFQIDNATITPKKEIISGSKVLVRTTQRPIVTYNTRIPNIPIYIQGGYRSGENATLKYVRYNRNGVINDTIILGESSIILGITKIN